MRAYLISNKASVCSPVPQMLGRGEIVVSTREELAAAPLNSKRLLAIWNSLAGAERCNKIGDRTAFIERLWSQIEALPDPAPGEPRRSKQTDVIALLRRPEGATVGEIIAATSWQRHSVRGFFAGALKKKLGLTLISEVEERGRVYRIVNHTDPSSRDDGAGEAIAVAPAA